MRKVNHNDYLIQLDKLSWIDNSALRAEARYIAARRSGDTDKIQAALDLVVKVKAAKQFALDTVNDYLKGIGHSVRAVGVSKEHRRSASIGNSNAKDNI